jgi:hypothetical protein
MVNLVTPILPTVAPAWYIPDTDDCCLRFIYITPVVLPSLPIHPYRLSTCGLENLSALSSNTSVVWYESTSWSRCLRPIHGTHSSLIATERVPQCSSDELEEELLDDELEEILDEELEELLDDLLDDELDELVDDDEELEELPGTHHNAPANEYIPAPHTVFTTPSGQKYPGSHSTHDDVFV